MSYATVNDIKGEFKDISFTPTTNVTDTSVNKFIVQATALINSYVGARYVVPITADADAVELMRLYCTTLVADRIKKILEVKQATNTSANQATRGEFSTKDVMAALNAIRKGEATISGATLSAGSGDGVFYSDNASNDRQPTFEKDKEQW